MKNYTITNYDTIEQRLLSIKLYIIFIMTLYYILYRQKRKFFMQK